MIGTPSRSQDNGSALHQGGTASTPAFAVQLLALLLLGSTLHTQCSCIASKAAERIFEMMAVPVAQREPPVNLAATRQPGSPGLSTKRVSSHPHRTWKQINEIGSV